MAKIQNNLLSKRKYWLILVKTPKFSADTYFFFLLLQTPNEVKKSTMNWELVFYISIFVYIFVYIMGRRNLMRTIWKRNQQLRIALDRAEESDRMKSAFIRSMSHEIRTPLNAINGFSQVLCMNGMDLSEEERIELEQRISTNVEIITVIINELLELAHGESIVVEQERTPMHVNDVCRTALNLAKASQHKDLVFSFESELPDDYTIYSNRNIVSEILNKVLNNAVKFTEEGGITLGCRLHEYNLQITVTDTGIGIPTDKFEEVFENFVKLNEYTEGVGLGLPISRRLAEALHGKLYIDRSYYEGTRFILELPVKFSQE